MKVSNVLATLFILVIFICFSVLSISEENILGEVAMASPPPLHESELSSLQGEIYVNPKYVGKINMGQIFNPTDNASMNEDIAFLL